MAAFVLSGVHAGVGKSVLALGLAAALRAEGLTVSNYAVGPGLLQYPPELSNCLGKLPQHAAGLDGWLLSPDAARAAFHSLSAGADISLIEGCLGMFDSPGADGSEQGSTAQVTQWLQAPVVLVIDAQAFKSARSIVALITGYGAVEGGLCVAGVILNKLANKALLGELAEGLTAAGLDVVVLGGVPKLEELSSSSSSSKQLACPWSPGSNTSSSCWSSSQCQHQQQQLLPCSPQHLGQLLAQHVDLQQLQAVAARAAVPQPLAPLPPAVRTYRVSMGIAHDEAFYQYFQQNLHMLSSAGVQLVPFSPLHESKLPPGLSAVLLGGGAVAEWGQQLAGNRPMLEALRAFAASGGLVMGEGAALMYLSRSLQRPGQQQRSMVGLFPFHTKEQLQDPCNALSYVAVDVHASAHPLLLPGSQLTGLASCCCQVVEERLVGGLSAALAAAASTAAPAADQQQTGTAADGAAVSTSTAAAEPQSSISTLRSMPVTHSYSCTPLGQQGTAAAVTAAVAEGYTCGTVLGSCVQLHYGSCPEIVQHITQRCLRVDVASVTAAASAAASQAAREAEEAAAAAAAVNAAAAAAAVAAAPAVLGMMRPPSPLLVPGTPTADAALLQAAMPNAADALQQQGQAAHGSRALSAPDLQRVLWQQCGAADAAAGRSTAGESWMAAYPAAAAAYSQSNAACRKSASIPSSMYQLAGTPDQQYLQQHMMAQQQGQPGMSRIASFNGMSQQQQQQQQQQHQHQHQQQGGSHSWHPLPLHVPKRWSLELQRLGSFTSQLLPGAKSPTGQQGQQGQQQQQHGRGHHSRNSSFGMGHLPEEAPLSDAALKVLDSSLPSLLGRTHQTHMGLAVPLSSAGSSSSGTPAAAAGGGGGTASCSLPGSFGAGGSFGGGGGPGSYLQLLEAGSISKSSSVHEQMLQLAASSAQQDGAAWGASAAPSACGESTACTEWEGSVCGEQQQKGGAAGWLPPGSSIDGLPPAGPHVHSGLQHKQQLPLMPQTQQRLPLDQRSAFSLHQQQQQQQQQAAAVAGSRMSFDSTVYPPAGLARIQQHLLPEEHSACSSNGITPELSLKGMLSQSLQQQHGTPCGSTDNLLAAAGTVSKSHSSSKLSGIGPMSKSNSSSKLSVQAPAAGRAAGSIVSLSPAATDCLIALGLTNRLSGITDACRLAEQASTNGSSSGSGGSSSFSSPLGPLLEGLVGADWASEAAAVAKVAAAECNVPVVCRLVDGPDGMPRYKLDEDHIRRAQPSLVVVACEENSRDEPHVQHHQQLQDSTRRKSAAGGGDAADAAQGSGAAAAANWSWPISPAGQVSSSTNGAVAVPGRVRLEVAVVQRVLQRAGVLWPEQRAVVLYQRCHSVSEVLEFILVLANAAGVPERGVQLVAGLRARLRAVACRVCSSIRSSGTSSLAVSSRGSGSCEGAAAGSAGSAVSPLVVVLDGVNPVRLAGFWLPEMLQLAGAKQASICPAAAEPPCNSSWGQLRAAGPGMLVLALQGLSAGQAALHMEQLAVQPGFWSLPAVRSGAVYAVDNTLLCRPGPGLVLGVELLGHLAAPEKQPLPAGLPMGSVLKLSLHSGQRCRPRLLPNYMARYC